MFAHKDPDSKEALIARQVAATVGALNGLLTADDMEHVNVEQGVEAMGRITPKPRHEDAQIALSNFGKGPIKDNWDQDDDDDDDDVKGDDAPMAPALKSGAVPLATQEKMGVGVGRQERLKMKHVRHASTDGSSSEGPIKHASNTQTQRSHHLGEAVEAAPDADGGEAVPAVTSSESDRDNTDPIKRKEDRRFQSEKEGDASVLDQKRKKDEKEGLTPKEIKNREKVLARLLGDLGRLEVLWTKCQDKHTVESHMRHNKGVSHTMVQALKDFPNEPQVYIKVCSLLLMSWSGYGKHVLESRESFGSDTQGIKLLGKAYHRFSAWGDYPNSEAFEMIERTLSTFRVTYSAAITLPHINRKINKFIAKPLFKRKALFLAENPVMGSECLWGKLRQKHQDALARLNDNPPDHCIVTLHSIIGRGLSIKDRVSGTSDPYIKIHQYEWDQPPRPDEPCLWRSFIQYKTTDPEWLLEAREQQHTSRRHFISRKKAAMSNIFEAKFNTNLKISFWDHDSLSHDDFMGRLEIDPTIIWVLRRYLKEKRDEDKKNDKDDSERKSEATQIERKASKKLSKESKKHKKELRKRQEKEDERKLKRSQSMEFYRQKAVLRKRAVTLNAYEFRQFMDEMMMQEDEKQKKKQKKKLKKMRKRKQELLQRQALREESEEKLGRFLATTTLDIPSAEADPTPITTPTVSHVTLREPSTSSSECEDLQRPRDNPLRQKLKHRRPEVDQTKEELEQAHAEKKRKNVLNSKSYGLAHSAPTAQKQMMSRSTVPDASDSSSIPTIETKDDLGNSGDIKIMTLAEEAELRRQKKKENQLRRASSASESSSEDHDASYEDDDDDDSTNEDRSRIRAEKEARESNRKSRRLRRSKDRKKKEKKKHRGFREAVRSTFHGMHRSAPVSSYPTIGVFAQDSNDKISPEPDWDTVPKKEIEEEKRRIEEHDRRIGPWKAKQRRKGRTPLQQDTRKFDTVASDAEEQPDNITPPLSEASSLSTSSGSSRTSRSDLSSTDNSDTESHNSNKKLKRSGKERIEHEKEKEERRKLGQSDSLVDHKEAHRHFYIHHRKGVKHRVHKERSIKEAMEGEGEAGKRLWITLVMPLYPGEELPAESPIREYYHKHITGTVKITLHISDPFVPEAEK